MEFGALTTWDHRSYCCHCGHFLSSLVIALKVLTAEVSSESIKTLNTAVSRSKFVKIGANECIKGTFMATGRRPQCC